MVVGEITACPEHADAYREMIGDLEFRLLEECNFGDALLDDNKKGKLIKDAGKIVSYWDAYARIEGVPVGRVDFYVAPHVFALGSFAEDKMHYGEMWAYLTNQVYSSLNEEQIKKVAEYREKYRIKE